MHLPVRTEFAIGAEPALARVVLAARMPVLVCWEHHGIPRLVRALGAHRVLGVPAPGPTATTSSGCSPATRPLELPRTPAAPAVLRRLGSVVVRGRARSGRVPSMY
ncbi:hypothetical protein ACFSNO_27025 [Streptomyces cirratus]